VKFTVASPKPLSIEDKELRGNPGKRNLHKDMQPKLQVMFELPPAPSYLGTYGIKEWDRTGPLLVAAKMLTESDLPAFQAYCMNIDLLIRAQLDIQANGMQVMGHRGWVRNPAIAAFGQASTAIRGFVSEFGLSPSARSRIRIPKDDQDVLGILLEEDNGEDFGEEL
jgi:P27 family predicted phage terminase small subunit